MAPDGLYYVDSWVTTDGARCFQVMECDDRSLLDAWIDHIMVRPRARVLGWGLVGNEPEAGYGPQPRFDSDVNLALWNEAHLALGRPADAVPDLDAHLTDHDLAELRHLVNTLESRPSVNEPLPQSDESKGGAQ